MPIYVVCACVTLAFFLVGDLHIQPDNIVTINQFTAEFQTYGICYTHTHTHTHTWCVMYTHVKHRNPDCICFLGDVFDKFEKIHYTALTAFTEMISALAPYVPQIIVIPGNHDFPTNNQFLQPGRTTLSPFSLHPKVQLVEVPTPVLQQKPTL